ncbi:MAG: hypothetical protein Q4D98_04615 [Planctomycetia bacterium]|nr:hypothetical protein [Planctomycetia bacterium]
MNRFSVYIIVFAALAAAGCQSLQPTSPCVKGQQGPSLYSVPPSTTTVRGCDPYQVWETVVDVVRLYFDRIENEYPCQRNGNIITEGLLKTYPQIGATYFEPWRRDSVNHEERKEATLQTIRRIASVRVRSLGNAYTIDVRVEKELEDLAKPSSTQFPSATYRLDTDIPDVNDPIAVRNYREGWIPQGRDVALEQEILRQLQGRLGAAQ